VEDAADAGDHFGWSVAVGDFDGDGFGDLAIGAYQEDLGSIVDAGAVNVLYGSAGGLQADAPPDQLWHQDSPGVAGRAEKGDNLGRSLTTGDFNGDGFHDLVMGAPGQDVGSQPDAGVVNVLYGSGGGLQAVAPDDQMYFDGDGFADLAVGVHHEDLVG
jgi:hypothetical protein